MGIFDKLKNTAKKTTGQANETVADHSGDKDLRSEGQKDRADGRLGNAGEDVKDAFGK